MLPRRYPSSSRKERLLQHCLFFLPLFHKLTPAVQFLAHSLLVNKKNVAEAINLWLFLDAGDVRRFCRTRFLVAFVGASVLPARSELSKLFALWWG